MTSPLTSIGSRDVDASTLTAALADAHLPTLLATLAYATGDQGVLRPEFRPTNRKTALGVEAHGGIDPAQWDAIRELAADLIPRIRAGELTPSAPPTRADVDGIFEFLFAPLEPEYHSLLWHELGVEDDLAATWSKDEIAPDVDFTVAIIGAGLAGIGAAYRLKQAGIPFVLIDRNEQVGGVWWENDYPGCHLDTSNFGYTYSFAQNPSWEEEFSSRAAVLEYLQSRAEMFGLGESARLGTEVVRGEYDEATASWTLTLKNSSGELSELTVQAVISAVGQLNSPIIPGIAGIEEYQGASWHTARWRHDIDLTGKRVAVIGTGASAVQAIQQVAKIAANVTIYQRTPTWVQPTKGYNSPMRPSVRWLLENVPGYYRWTRVYRLWSGMGRREFTLVDPAWSDPETNTVSAKNKQLRDALAANIETQLADRPDLIAKMMPSYPPYAKRVLRDDGLWFETLKRSNVEVVTEPITRASRTGLVSGDGMERDFDAIVYGTGFSASRFLSSLPLVGRNGTVLAEQWHGDDARAYYGMTVPNFPNLFCLYGPNTNVNGNSSVAMLMESSTRYILECLHILLRERKRAMEVRPEVLDAYDARIDAASRSVVYGVATVNSWYKNSKGRLTQNWPLRSVDYWTETASVSPDDYLFS